MIAMQQSAGRRTIRKREKNSVLPESQSELRFPLDSLLRDVALVLHATAAIRRTIDEEKATYATNA